MNYPNELAKHLASLPWDLNPTHGFMEHAGRYIAVRGDKVWHVRQVTSKFSGAILLWEVWCEGDMVNIASSRGRRILNRKLRQEKRTVRKQEKIRKSSAFSQQNLLIQRWLTPEPKTTINIQVNGNVKLRSDGTDGSWIGD